MPKISAKAVGDSISPKGVRVTTLELGFPRFILPEYNTHRDFSRNSASSRAVPIKKQIEQVLNDPALPIIYGTNMAGMQSRDPLPEELAEACKGSILDLRLEAISKVEELSQLGLHKQWTNRYLEPWLWHTVVCTATRWENFFHQRLHEDAQPEIKELAACMYHVLEDSQPVEIDYDDWHLPYLVQSDSIYDLEDRMKISAARCAGVSYLNQGKVDAVKDLARFEKLMGGEVKHWSPLEHVATPFYSWLPWRKPLGNFDGWSQYRHNLNSKKEKLR